MARRSALLVVCLCTLVPALHRAVAARPVRRPACAPAGRGRPPRHWIGCAEDAGPPRDLSGAERLARDLPIELNGATPEDLAVVPGLTPRLAIDVVRDRARAGPFAQVDDLIRVRGIGPARLAHARPFLTTVR